MHRFVVYAVIVFSLVVPVMAQAAQQSVMAVKKNGRFSAVLMVLDEATLKEFEKPSDQGLFLKGKATAKRGESVFIKVGFANMATDSRNMANVTFSLKVTDPDGKIVGEEAHDIPAYQGEILNPVATYNSQAHIEIKFEPSDKSGFYTISSTIKDNIGGAEISETKRVELVD